MFPPLTTRARAVPSVTLHSSLAPEECAAILKRTTTPEGLFETFSVPSGTIICKLGLNSFRLRQKRGYRNSFAPFFYGNLLPRNGGTDIAGQFRMHPFVIAFMAVWFGFLALIGGALALSSAHQLATGGAATKNSNPIVGLLIPAGMLIFGVGLVKFGKWLGRSEETAMAAFLSQTFSGAKAPPALASLPGQSPAEATLVGPILFFTALGLSSVGAGVAEILGLMARMPNPSLLHIAVSPYRGASGPAFAFLDAAFLLFLAYGTWKRLYIAWAAAFLLIVIGAVSFMASITAGSPLAVASRPPSFMIAVMAPAALAVVAYWSYWWYKKRDYFLQ